MSSFLFLWLIKFNKALILFTGQEHGAIVPLSALDKYRPLVMPMICLENLFQGCGGRSCLTSMIGMLDGASPINLSHQHLQVILDCFMHIWVTMMAYSIQIQDLRHIEVCCFPMMYLIIIPQVINWEIHGHTKYLSKY